MEILIIRDRNCERIISVSIVCPSTTFLERAGFNGKVGTVRESVEIGGIESVISCDHH